jgi:hypothetical protein
MQPSSISLCLKAFLTWLYTNVIAAVCYLFYMLASGTLEPLSSVISFDALGMIILLGLVFSSPALLFLIPALYMMHMFRHWQAKLAYAIGIVLFLCLVVILFFFQFFDVPDRDKHGIIIFLLPYIIGSVISFLLVARKLIVTDRTGITDSHPEKI